jgi:hypothetical protein
VVKLPVFPVTCDEAPESKILSGCGRFCPLFMAAWIMVAWSKDDVEAQSMDTPLAACAPST